MATEDWLAGIGGALKGGVDAYSWQKEYQQKDRQIDTQKENAVLRAQVQEMIARLNAGSRETIAGKGNETKVEVANIGADSRRDVATTTQEGATGRNDVNAGVTRRGQDLNYSIAGDRNDTNVLGIKTRSQDSRYSTDTGATTARRGQDVGASTARRGQDISADTGRRGQDLNYTLGGERNAVTQRGQDVTAGTAAAGQAAATARAKMRRPAFSFDTNAPDLGDETATHEDVNLPVEGQAPAPPAGVVPQVPHAPLPQSRGTIPVTPRAMPGGPPPPIPSAVPAAGPLPPRAMADPAAGVQNPATQLALQATALLLKSRAEKDPVKKSAYQAELAKLREQILAMRQGAR